MTTKATERAIAFDCLTTFDAQFAVIKGLKKIVDGGVFFSVLESTHKKV